MAKILIGVAEQIWEEVGDQRNAIRARELYETIPAPFERENDHNIGQ